MAEPRLISTGCCIVGGGPAGMMLGYILARAGVAVTVLEKHGDFLRDFRGDTVHPSTLQVMHQLGLLAEFLELPHQRLDRVSGQLGDEVINAADFRHLPVAAPFIALMPQWDFLNFLADKGRTFPEFKVLMRAEATDLIRDGGTVVGVAATTPDGALEVRASLVIGCDGRTSTVRDKAGLPVKDLGAPMDVLWMRLPRRPDDGEAALGRMVAGRIFVMIPRGDYFQCGYVVAKGEADRIMAEGLDALRRSIETIAPIMKGRTGALKSLDDVKLLTVSVDRLTDWCIPGLLCIGDAAHAMSPVGGIGINLAIQDAVAAANLLWRPLSRGHVALAELQAVQKRRLWPTEVTQAGQVAVQKRVIAPTLAGATPKPPWFVRLLSRSPLLQRIPARLLGMGVRFEAVRAPDAHGR